MFSINDLDVAKACETSFEFEVKDDETGKGTGIFISVIGGHAQVIADRVAKKMNERRTEEAMAAKRDPRGKQTHVVPVEDDLENNLELVAMRVTAWRGISDTYSPENAVLLCRKNPSIKDQILATSENLKNFPSAFSKLPASTSDIQLG